MNMDNEINQKMADAAMTNEKRKKHLTNNQD